MKRDPMAFASALLLLLGSCNGAWAKETEEQRKYAVPSPLGAAGAFLEESRDGGFSVRRHSVYRVFDFYLDTPDFRVRKLGLSLRLRRAIKDKGELEYELQIKSEMQDSKEIRMEVEEKTLLSLQWIRGKGLPTLLDELTEDCEKGSQALRPDLWDRAKVAAGLAALREWIASKENSSLAPFQELRHQGVPIRALRPVLYGSSSRARSHIYATGSGKEEWVMEASLDQSRFFPLVPEGRNDRASARIGELEVENKAASARAGRAHLDRFEKTLVAQYGFRPSLASKFLRAAQLLYPSQEPSR